MITRPLKPPSRLLYCFYRYLLRFRRKRVFEKGNLNTRQDAVLLSIAAATSPVLFCSIPTPSHHFVLLCLACSPCPAALSKCQRSATLVSPPHSNISSFATNHPSLPNPSLTFTSSDRPRLPPHLHPRRRRLQALSITVAKPKQLADPIPALQLTCPLLASRTGSVHSPEYI
jgi:hypothetical protein